MFIYNILRFKTSNALLFFSFDIMATTTTSKFTMHNNTYTFIGLLLLPQDMGGHSCQMVGYKFNAVNGSTRAKCLQIRERRLLTKK